MNSKELMKQYKSLVRNIESLSDGQASITQSPNGEDNEDDLSLLYINISPNDGPYKGGSFVFKFDLSDGYPDISPPSINCLTKVYHPNIDLIDEYSEGEICLNLLDELWSPELTLEDYVQGLLFMFYNPNIEDPLNPSFNGTEDWEEFLENVQLSMMGEDVEGVEYEPVIVKSDREVGVSDEETETNDNVIVRTGETTPIAEEKDVVTMVTESKSVFVERINSRDDATGQCEGDVPVGVASPVEEPRLLATAQMIKNGLPLILIGVGVWAGLSLMKRLAVR